MPKSKVSFPTSVVATTVYEIATGRQVKIFMLDASVPLFNILFGNIKFLATKEQTLQQIEACKQSEALEMPAPAWEWKLDAGFEKSVDGHSKKGWVMTPL